MSNFIWILGRYSALFGTGLILLQLLLICWGKKTNIHKINGRVALTLILVHGISMFYVYGLSVLKMEDVFKALIALLLLVFIVFTSIVIRNKLKYETWYNIHLLTYFAILLAFGHQLKLGTDFNNNMMVIFWYSAYAFTFLNVLFFKFLRLAWNFWKYKFFVEKIVRETDNVVSVYISGKDIENFNFEPGQYVVIRFLTKDLVWQAHPFSISSMPGEKNLRLTIKNSGNFTSQLSTKPLALSTSVILDGPYGTFTAKNAKQKKILLLAGGVGVTPLRGLIEKFTALKNDVIMIYSSKSKEDAIFSKELAKYKIRYFYTEKGQRLGKEMLLKLVFDVEKREAYVCGSASFNIDMKTCLKSLGVQCIHTEEFGY